MTTRNVSQRWSAKLRVGVALLGAMAFYWLYAGLYAFSPLRTGRGLFFFSPTGTIIRRQAVHSFVVERLVALVQSGRVQLRVYMAWWDLAYAIGTVLPAALVGTALYALLT